MLKQKFLEFGYTEEDYNLIRNSHVISTYTDTTLMKQIINITSYLLGLGYTREEVIKMTKSLPALYSLSIENIREKIEFYDSINMHELAVKDPKQLMQSVALSYARYNFYLSKGIEINMVNYKKLFINNKKFEKTYGKTKQEILEEYNYDLYINKNKTL